MGALVFKFFLSLKSLFAANTSAVLVLLCGSVYTALACAEPPSHSGIISMSAAVTLTEDERAFVQSIPTLRAAAYWYAPPLSSYDEKTAAYQGVSIDVFRFIADDIGLSYELVSDTGTALKDNFKHIQQGTLDVYLSLSTQPERLKYGSFTQSFFADYYAVIARKDEPVKVSDLNQLRQYRVGAVHGVSILPYLQSFIPEQQLREYPDGRLLQALRGNEVDMAIYMQSVFEQERFHFNLFDLKKVYTLSQAPRSYAFLFHNSEQNQRLIDIFNRYIAVIDVSQSVEMHASGQRELIKRYVKQQSHQQILLVGVVTISVVLIILLLAYRGRQRILIRLAASHAYILKQHQALQEANEKLEHLSQVDALTGLFNRRYFNQQFQLEYARYVRGAAALSVLMMDIDHFKSINDHYGHAVGDEYLQRIAAVLATVLLRPNDLAARFGGEEFVCILPGTDLPGALKVAEAIRQAVIDLGLDNAEQPPGPVTVSLGVATLQGTKSSTDELLKQADIQLYRAKNAGRNQVCGIVLNEHE